LHYANENTILIADLKSIIAEAKGEKEIVIKETCTYTIKGNNRLLGFFGS